LKELFWLYARNDTSAVYLVSRTKRKMSKLIEELKRKFKTPQAALQALGLDAKLLSEGEDAWSEEARKKALETRKANAKSSGKLSEPNPEHHKSLSEKGWIHTGTSKKGQALYHHPIFSSGGQHNSSHYRTLREDQVKPGGYTWYGYGAYGPRNNQIISGAGKNAQSLQQELAKEHTPEREEAGRERARRHERLQEATRKQWPNHDSFNYEDWCESEEGEGAADSALNSRSTRSQIMSKLSTKSARAVVDALKRRGLLAYDASPEEAAKAVEEIKDLEAERGEDEFDPNSGLPSYMEKEKEKDAEDAFETAEEREEDKGCDRRAADTRTSMGRDETPAEREEREEKEAADAARTRLGRDETAQECMDRRARDRRARDYRAARDTHRSARDRLLHASDAVRKHYGDMRKAEDAYKRAKDEAERAKENNNATDARRAADEMSKAEEMRSKAEDACMAARDALKQCHDAILTARDARMRARDARRMSRDSKEEKEVMTRGEVEDALRARDSQHRGAMDAAIKSERERSSKFNDAMRIVRPVVGELALDSALTADDVFRASLKIIGVKTDGVHPSAYPELFKMAAQQRAVAASRSRFAHDSALDTAVPKVTDLIPGLDRIRAI
jgi:hypothetical protein